MKTSEGFLHSPDCSDLCEESHVRLLSLANRISSNRFSEKSGSQGCCVLSNYSNIQRDFGLPSLAMYVCVSMHIIIGFFPVFFCLHGVVLDVMREIL